MKKLIAVITALAIVCTFAVAFAAAKTVSDFDAADIAAYMSLFHTDGTEDPTLAAADGEAGKGVLVTAGSTQAFAQTFLISDADTVSAVQGTTDGYFAIWVNNTSASAQLQLRVTFFSATGGRLAFDCTEATLVASNGDTPEIATGNDGFGDNSTLIIPAGFKGFAYFPISSCTINAPASWGCAAMSDLGSVKTLDLDIHPIFGEDTSCSYILDSARLVSSIPQNVPTTADLSVAAYAVAALTGCGALVAARKRK